MFLLSLIRYSSISIAFFFLCSLLHILLNYPNLYHFSHLSISICSMTIISIEIQQVYNACTQTVKQHLCILACNWQAKPLKTGLQVCLTLPRCTTSCYSCDILYWYWYMGSGHRCVVCSYHINLTLTKGNPKCNQCKPTHNASIKQKVKWLKCTQL